MWLVLGWGQTRWESLLWGTQVNRKENTHCHVYRHRALSTWNWPQTRVCQPDKCSGHKCKWSTKMHSSNQIYPSILPERSSKCGWEEYSDDFSAQDGEISTGHVRWTAYITRLPSPRKLSSAPARPSSGWPKYASLGSEKNCLGRERRRAVLLPAVCFSEALLLNECSTRRRLT